MPGQQKFLLNFNHLGSASTSWEADFVHILETSGVAKIPRMGGGLLRQPTGESHDCRRSRQTQIISMYQQSQALLNWFSYSNSVCCNLGDWNQVLVANFHQSSGALNSLLFQSHVTELFPKARYFQKLTCSSTYNISSEVNTKPYPCPQLPEFSWLSSLSTVLIPPDW